MRTLRCLILVSILLPCSAVAMSPEESKCYDKAGNLTGQARVNFMAACLKKPVQKFHEAPPANKQGVAIGMSQEDVLHSMWGKPKEINRTTTAIGVHEQWVYGGHSFLYFDNGVLTAIQN